MENFKPVFDQMLEGLFVDRMEGNEDIFDRLMNDAEFRNIAANDLMRDIYHRLRGN
jgi:type I restriction enzyme R subunit